jgi:hypothetical protein
LEVVMQPIHSDYANLRRFGRIYLQFLWLSVAWCLIAAILVLQIESEGAKLMGAGLFGFSMMGVAFARAFRKLQNPRWWHWLLGTLVVAPGAIFIADLY